MIPDTLNETTQTRKCSTCTDTSFLRRRLGLAQRLC